MKFLLAAGYLPVLLCLSSVVVFAAPTGPGTGPVPCRQNCDNNEGLVTFPQEYATIEHATEGMYKDLVCYPDNFCTIQWLKDGKSFPWGLSKDNLASMGVAYGGCNYTLAFKRVAPLAEGNYTCVATGANGTTIQRNIELRVKATPPPVTPIPRAGPNCSNQSAALGSQVTFRCDVFVGMDSPSMSFSYWMKETGPDQWEIADGSSITSGFSPGSPGFITSWLNISNVSPATYGKYKLIASNPYRNSETNFELRRLGLCVGIQIV